MKLYNPFCLAALTSLALSATAARAVVIDFESFNVSDTISGPGVFADVEFNSTDRTLIVSSNLPGTDFSGSKSVEGDPFSGNPFEATFSIGDVNMVSVAVGDFGGDNDAVFLRAYDSFDGLLDEDAGILGFFENSITLSVNSGSGSIAYVLFGNENLVPNSFYFDNFSYGTSSTEPPPPPPTRVPDTGATFALLMMGVGLLGAARRFFL